MEKEVYFYYDESAHSRKLTTETLTSRDFKHDFVSTIIGISIDVKDQFENDFYIFENKWKNYYSVSELKSTVIKRKKYKYGLASFKEKDIDFYLEFFEILIKYKVYLHFGVFNKIEYLMLQMLETFETYDLTTIQTLSYSMAKSICVYRPKKVLSALANEKNDFLPLYIDFLEHRRQLNKRVNGESEEYTFALLIAILDSLKTNINLNWEYVFSFDGFVKYISELDLSCLSLSIDKEGSGETLSAALKDGIANVNEIDSKDSIGIRCADLLSGFLSNMIASIQEDTAYEENEISRDESLLSQGWFNKISSKTFSLYKKAHDIFCLQNNSWYKYYSSSYSDGLIGFLALLKYFSEYGSYIDFKDKEIIFHQQRVNTILFYDLTDHFENLNKTFKVQEAHIQNDHYFDKRGTEFCLNFNKHKMLPNIDTNEVKEWLVFSVGFFPLGKDYFYQPSITVSNNGVATCYLLPRGFEPIVNKYLSLAINGHNVFPSFVKIGFDKGKYIFELCKK